MIEPVARILRQPMIAAARRLMTTAVSEILKQAERLSPDEQVELATNLMEQAQRHAEASSQLCTEEDVSENEEEGDWLDTLDLKLMPLKIAYTKHVRYRFVGRMKPLPYDFGDLFDDKEEVEVNAVNSEVNDDNSGK